MNSFFVPNVKIVVQGSLRADEENGTIDWRSWSVVSTLMDYVRRKELNRSVDIEVDPSNNNGTESVNLIVFPEEATYSDVRPESIPSIVDRHTSVQPVSFE